MEDLSFTRTHSKMQVMENDLPNASTFNEGNLRALLSKVSIL